MPTDIDRCLLCGLTTLLPLTLLLLLHLRVACSQRQKEAFVNHCLVIFDSLLPDTTVMHDVKASRESSRTKNALKLPEKEVA